MRRRDNAEVEEEAARRKKKSWHPAVMENLMRQAQEEDYRREQMAELERSARSHFADIGGEDGG
ncbi:hypothetical protein VXS30_25960 [Escherichia coli]|uniref:hypothetical protein n=1 Tax=Escherichia coli TaxID=562 RepID=UPI001493C605|nr:hypothetical protein [Escherichia coli]EIZ7000244.1 hypothetical protein [Shigella boydii]MEC6614733.1 hypothetical protein [Escherichia coli]NPI77048.1 hypothetical protein [Escherichia coli]NPI77053.1 hypothetical protein [Escherichia coli]